MEPHGWIAYNARPALPSRRGALRQPSGDGGR